MKFRCTDSKVMISSCLDGFHRAEQYSSLLLMSDLYRHIMVVSDLSLNTESAQEMSFRALLAIMLMWGDQFKSGVRFNPRSLTISEAMIGVPFVLEELI